MNRLLTAPPLRKEEPLALLQARHFIVARGAGETQCRAQPHNSRKKMP